jgi:hypothetical protein
MVLGTFLPKLGMFLLVFPVKVRSENNPLKVILLHCCNYGKDVHILKCCLHDYSNGIYLLLHDQTVCQIVSDEYFLIRFIVVITFLR